MPSAPFFPVNLRRTSRVVIQQSPSPEPEPALQQQLGPMTIANRTPSPQEKRQESKDDTIPVEPPSPMVPSVLQPTPPLANIGPLSLDVPAASSTPPPGSHLGPSLHELRGGQPGQLEQGQRRSLFFPRPKAPKAPSVHSAGPMYFAKQ